MTWSPRLALLLVACLAGCEPAPPRQQLDPQALRVQLRQLASLSAEAELFTQELAAGHASHGFAWVHQQVLGDEARRVAADLARPAPTQLQPAQHAALLLVAAMQQDLTRIAPARRQPGELRALRERFADMRHAAQTLEPAP